MSHKSFASSADLAEKEQTLELLADGVYALTAEGDPNVGAIEGEDFLVCFEAMATPAAARGWLAQPISPCATWCFRITTRSGCSVRVRLAPE